PVLPSYPTRRSSDLNAIQTFTDTSQDDFILRITVISGLLVDSGKPVVAIRKIPKDKYNLGTLEETGMFKHKESGKKIKLNLRSRSEEHTSELQSRFD